MQALDVSKSFQDKGVTRQVLEEITVSVEKNSRIGLVGDNGSGKSTLLKILCGEEKPDTGKIVFGRGETVGYVPQVLFLGEEKDSEETVLEYVKRVLGLEEVEKELHHWEEEISRSQGEGLEKASASYSSVWDQFEALGGYSIESRIEEVLDGLNIGVLLRDKVKTLSGGQRTRLLLGIVLLRNPSILLLDEPTNHLDSAGISWFTAFLENFSGGLVIVSHNSEILNKVTKEIWELETKTHQLNTFPGDFDSYLEQKRKGEERVATNYRHQQEVINRLTDTARKLKQYARSGGEASLAKRAKAIERRLDRMEKVEKPRVERKISFPLAVTSHIPEILAEVGSVTKSFSGNVCLDSTSLVVRRSDRVALFGPNGSGKTTLIRIIIGEETADGGQVKLGRGVKVGYLSQLRIEIEAGRRVIEDFRLSVSLAETEIRRYLSQFLFTQDDVNKKIVSLSEGERTRLFLAKLCLSGSNLLILDEPTNHLDIESKERLAEELLAYPGAILVSSHDQDFLEQININRVLLLNDGKLKEI